MLATLKAAARPLVTGEVVTPHLATSHHHRHLHFPCKQGVPLDHDLGAMQMQKEGGVTRV